MSEAIAIIDTSEIHKGRLEQLKTAMTELAEFVETNEPQVIAYNVYVDEEQLLVTVFQLHPDSASAELHVKVASPAFRTFTESIRLLGIDVYGMPSPELLEGLRRKAELLGTGSVVVHAPLAGFTRSVFAESLARGR